MSLTIGEILCLCGYCRGEMTFFHEIGHSMNADHDDTAEFHDRKEECNPSDAKGGSYLMYPTSTEGLLPNNRVYSYCSLDSISYVFKRRNSFSGFCQLVC